MSDSEENEKEITEKKGKEKKRYKRVLIKKRPKKTIGQITKKDQLWDDVNIMSESKVNGNFYYANLKKNKSFVYEKVGEHEQLARVGMVIKGKMIIPKELNKKYKIMPIPPIKSIK